MRLNGCDQRAELRAPKLELNLRDLYPVDLTDPDRRVRLLYTISLALNCKAVEPQSEPRALFP